MSNLIHWTWGRKHLPILKEDDQLTGYSTFERELNRLFEPVFGFGSAVALPQTMAAGFTPKIDLSENETALTVTAELPGLTESDIDLSLDKDLLTIKGEKKAEKEDKQQGYYRLERSYGSFQRTIPLPVEVDSEQSEATFKNGVLTVTIPKVKKAELERKKIPIKQG
jgi:HSP20 family protein